MSERTVPILKSTYRLPWSVFLEAYNAYTKKYGTAQSAERLAARGGFSERELDMFAPNWRDQVQELARFRKALQQIAYAPPGQSGPDLETCISIARAALKAGGLGHG